MGNNVNDINKVIKYGYRRKYSFLNIKISKNDIKKYDNYVILYIIKEDNLKFWIIEKYFFPKVKRIKVFKNLLNNDNSITYLLYLNENEEELIYNIHYLYYFNFDILIKNQHLENTLNYNYFKESDLISDYNRYLNIYNILKSEYHIDFTFCFRIFKNRYIKPIIINFAKAELISYNYQIKNNKNISELYDLYDTLLMDMLGVKKSDLKRTAELFYLKKFRDIFPDTIYQYKTEWLGKQSLDLYIPSKKVGIEIQGKQHYKPIDYFGGKRQFIKQKELDDKKARLCKENNIILYYISNCEINYESTTFDSIVDKIVNNN